MEGVKISEKSKTVKQLDFIIDAASAADSRKLAVQRISRSVRIEGFRAGKAPVALIEKDFGEDIRNAQESYLLSKKVYQVCDENKIIPVAPAKLTEFKWDGDKPVKFSVEVEVMPEFEAGGYKKISIKEPSVAVTDEEAEQALQNLREKAFSLEKTELSKPKKGLFIKYDLGVICAGETQKKMSRRNLTAELDEKKIFPPLWPDILKLKKGEAGEIKFTADKDFKPAEFAGKEVTYVILITEIFEKKLPPLDDSFASLFGAKNLPELRESLKKRMIMEKESEKHRSVREQITAALLKKNNFELPASLLEEEKKSLSGHLSEQYPGQDMKAVGPQIEKTAGENLRISLILGKIAEKENITVTEEELKEKLGKNYSPSTTRMKDALLTDKIFDFIIKEGNVK
ncbi:MAG: trigger factor [Candidatus Omnitrophota bacterium]|nr:trigger factor [Candidatus Omnitrophota bacterium]MBU2528231.1 trigger factor [bacterium]MBU3929609.1 trigger factor [bacterium]MBU4122501.1 trigger factor [bacterium]